MVEFVRYLKWIVDFSMVMGFCLCCVRCCVYFENKKYRDVSFVILGDLEFGFWRVYVLWKRFRKGLGFLRRNKCFYESGFVFWSEERKGL